MYTRRHTPRRVDLPPPGYSGSAIQPPSDEEMILSPPPPAISPAPIRPAPVGEGMSPPMSIETRCSGDEDTCSRRPDLDRPPRSRPRRSYRLLREEDATVRRATIRREDASEAVCEEKKSLLSGLESDDLLLIGLILLFLWGGEDGVEHPDILLILGLLFFIGKTT